MNKGWCIYILNRAIVYYTKATIKIILLILIFALSMLFLFGMKYKYVYKVTIQGEEVGYVNSKEEVENRVQEFIANSGKEIAFVVNENLPEYELVLNADNTRNDTDAIIEKLENTPVVAYKSYAIILDDETTEIVNSADEANGLIDEIKQTIDEDYQLALGVEEIYTLNTEPENVAELDVARSVLEEDVSKKIAILDSTINGVYFSQPISGVITSRYGSISSIRSSAHTGLDIANATGTPIRPTAPGVVKKAEYSGNYGNLVVVEHKYGLETYYAHCSKLFVKPGDEVDTDTIIANVGSTGNSTGPHLHLEIRINGEAINPQEYLYRGR